MEYSKKNMSLKEMRSVVEDSGRPYKSIKKLDHNTYCVFWDYAFKLTTFFFYKTPIVSFVRNLIVFDVRGNRTRTTKERLNNILREYSFSIHSEGGNECWFIMDRDRNVIPFKDDLVIGINENFKISMPTKCVERN